MYQIILVPLDGSELAKQVIPHVAQFARAFGSEVIVINVCGPEESEAGQVCRLYVQNEAEQLEKAISGSAARTRSDVLSGVPDEQLLRYAKEARADIIFVSSHGRSGAKRGILGSTVNRILHKTGVPLIVVRVTETPAKPDNTGLFRRILVPLDGSERGARVLPFVSGIAEKLESEVILLRVVETGKHVHTIGGLNYIPYKNQDIEAAKKTAREYLDKVGAGLAGTRAIIKSEVRSGDSAAEILKFADEAECSLVALSSHGHSSIEAWAFGSVTYKILQTGNKSVLFVPAFQA